MRRAVRRDRRVPGRARAAPSRRRTRPCRRCSGRPRSRRRCSPISFASSTIATHLGAGALGDVHGVADVVGVAVGQEDVRRARARRASTAAFGLPVRNGSIRTRVSPSVSSKQAWPRKRMSIGQSPPVVVVSSSRASSQPTATPTSIPIRVSSASSVRTARTRSSWSGAGRGLAHLAPRAPRRTSRPRRAPGRGCAGAGGAIRGHARLGLAEALGLAERLERRVDLRVGERALGHGADNRQVTAARLTALSHGAGLRLQARPPAELHAAARRASRRAADPSAARRLRHRRRRGRLPAATTGARLDRRLLHPDRRRPLRLRPDRGRQRAVRRLRDGRAPLTALNLVAFSLEALAADAPARDPARRRRRGGRGRRGRSWAATRSTTPSRSTGWRSPARSHPDRCVRNSTARAGDELYLTKPWAAAWPSTAMKRGTAPPEGLAGACDVMTTLNRAASRRRAAAGRRAMTDVTGFGLLGHLTSWPGERRGGRGRRAAVPAHRWRARPALAGDEPPIAGRHPPQPRLGGAVGRVGRRRAGEPAGSLCDAMTSGGLLVAAPRRRSGALGLARSAASSRASPAGSRVRA